MTEVALNGTTFYYERSGSGIPCIALHGGLGFDHSYFHAALGPLEDRLDVIYLDQRCNGRSGRPPIESITMPQLASDVDALREHLGLDRVAVLGHSYGGFVALECATRFPERVSHLFLVDTSPGAFEPTPEELAERGDPSWITPEVDASLSAMFGEFPSDAEAFRAALPAIAPAYVRTVSPDRITEVIGTTILNADALARGFEILPAWSVASDLDRITCPTLVLCGRYDLHTTPECSKRLATAIGDAELVWFEKSAHFPWIEEPDAFTAAVADFVDRHPL